MSQSNLRIVGAFSLLARLYVQSVEGQSAISSVDKVEIVKAVVVTELNNQRLFPPKTVLHYSC